MSFDNEHHANAKQSLNMTYEQRQEYITKILLVLNGLTYDNARWILDEATQKLDHKAVLLVSDSEKDSRDPLDALTDEIARRLAKSFDECDDVEG